MDFLLLGKNREVGESMSWSDLVEEKSSLAVALDIVGDKWSLMILSGCFTGVCRFNQFERYLGINRNLLSSRLDKMVKFGLIKRRPYQLNPPRYEYNITDVGKALRPVIVGLADWGEVNFTKEDAPLEIVHKGCGGHVRLQVVCQECDTVLKSMEVQTNLREGAGDVSKQVYAQMYPDRCKTKE